MMRKLERLKLSAARTAGGFVAGLLTAFLPAPLAFALFAVYLLAAVIGLGRYARGRLRYIGESEAYYVGLVSGLAAYGIGVVMGSALAV